MNYTKTQLAVVAALALAGCAELPVSDVAAAHEKDLASKKEIGKGRAVAAATRPVARAATGINESAYITSAKTGASQRVIEEKSLPATFSQPLSMRFGPSPVAVSRVLRELETELRIPVRMSSDVFVGIPGATTTGQPGQAGAVVQPVTAPVFNPGIASGQQQPQATGLALLAPIELNVSGTRSDVLKQIASKMGLEFEYTNGEIVFSRYLTRTFYLEGSPRNITSNDTFSSTASSSGSAGASTSNSSAQNTMAIDASIKAFDDLEAQLKAIKTTAGQVVLSRSQNSVLVRDTRAVVEDAANIVDKHNSMMSRQVYVESEIISFKMDRSKAAGFDLALAFKSYTNGVPQAGVTFTGPTSLVSGGGSLIFNVINDPLNPSPYGGSKVFIDALNSYGFTYTVNKGAGYARNNVPLTFDKQNETSYVSATTPAPAGGAGTSTGTPGITQSSVTTGFLTRIYPTILSGNRVLIDGVLNISNLDSLLKSSAGAGGIEVASPNVSRQISPSGVILPSGSYVAMQAFEREVQGDNSKNGLLSFSRAKTDQVERVIILMRATILASE